METRGLAREKYRGERPGVRWFNWSCVEMKVTPERQCDGRWLARWRVGQRALFGSRGVDGTMEKNKVKDCLALSLVGYLQSRVRGGAHERERGEVCDREIGWERDEGRGE